MIAGVLLAAGAGSRFGAAKQLAVLDGRPLVEHALAKLAALDLVVVVLGAHADAIRARADLGAARVVRCREWDIGPGASLRCGLRALPAGVDAALVTLADQPRLASDAVDRLLAVARRDGAATLARATYTGAPGHPVALGAELIATLLARDDAAGAGALLDRAGVAGVECGDLGGSEDVDVPEDLDRLARVP